MPRVVAQRLESDVRAHQNGVEHKGNIPNGKMSWLTSIYRLVRRRVPAQNDGVEFGANPRAID